MHTAVILGAGDDKFYGKDGSTTDMIGQDWQAAWGKALERAFV